MLEAERDKLMCKMASSIGGTELAAFVFSQTLAGQRLRAVVHIRPDSSDAETRAAALAAFQEIIAPCIAQQKNGAIHIDGTRSDDGSSQYCLVALCRNGLRVSGAVGIIVRCQDPKDARRKLDILGLELSGHELFRVGRIRAVLFDLGDTLLDFDPLDPYQVFRDGAELIYQKLKPQLPAGLSLDEYCARQSRTARWRYYFSRLIGREFDCMRMIDGYHSKLGVKLDLDTQHEMMWTWYQAMLRHARFGDEVLPTLEALRDRGLKLGLVSNTFIPPLTHDRHLRESGLLEFFPVRVYSSEVRYRKPHRRIFELALQRMGTSASQTLFVGDQLKADISGARRVGMKTAWRCRDGSTVTRERPDYTIRSVADLVDELAQ
jgi:putative hydrolase of the HAD superfamily